MSPRKLLFLACYLISIGTSGPLSAQYDRELVDPRLLGLDIEPGKVVLGKGECVTTADADGNPTVGKTYLRIGDAQVVLLPDGQLVARSNVDAQPTDRPFEAESKDKIAARLLQGQLRGFQTKQTRRYLYVYNTSEEFSLATSRILETMFPGVVAYAKAQKIDTHDPEVPLVVLMFRTEDQFQQFQRMPQGVVAYYNTLTNHVVMYEESRLVELKPELAIQQSISTIAHEGVHQILHNIGVQQRLSMWPMWLSEGLAEFFAPTTFGKRLGWRGAGEVNDMRMFELEMYLKSREADQPSGQMVEHTVAAGRLTSTGYASAWSLTHYLAKNRRANFNNYVREISQLGPLETAGEIVAPGVVEENVALFKKHFGDDLQDVETRLVQHLKKLPYNDPFAEWPHFVAMLAVPDGRRAKRDANLFHTESMAQKWIVESLETVTAEQRAAAQISVRPFPNRTVAAQYARQWLGQ